MKFNLILQHRFISTGEEVGRGARMTKVNKEKIILKEEGIYFIDIGKYSIVELEVMQIGFIL